MIKGDTDFVLKCRVSFVQALGFIVNSDKVVISRDKGLAFGLWQLSEGTQLLGSILGELVVDWFRRGRIEIRFNVVTFFRSSLDLITET